MDRLEHGRHFFHFSFGNDSEDIPIKMHYTPLPRSLRIEVSKTLYEPKAFIRYEQFYSLETSFLEISQKSAPTRLVLFGSFGYSQDLPIAFFIDSECNQNRYVLYLSTPAPLQAN